MTSRATTKGPRGMMKYHRAPTVNVMVELTDPLAGSLWSLRGQFGRPDLGWQQ